MHVVVSILLSQGQRSKREEIRKLQAELALRDLKIKSMKEQEKVYFIEAEKFKVIPSFNFYCKNSRYLFF